jgi:hypothetical protein
MPQFLVFPSDDDFESVTPDFPLNGAAMDAVLTRTFPDMAMYIQAPSVSGFLEPTTCRCGCGKRLRGKQTYASDACRKRASRRSVPPPARISACVFCKGWRLGGGTFKCESCAGSDPTYASPLLRLAPRHDNPLRDVMLYIGTTNVLCWRRGDMHEIVTPHAPIVDALIRRLGGHGNLVPTAALIEEAAKQKDARAGHLPQRGPVPPSEKDAEMHAAVVRDREVWRSQPVSAALLVRQGTDSKEHNERTEAKYAALAHEQPELFE